MERGYVSTVSVYEKTLISASRELLGGRNQARLRNSEDALITHLNIVDVESKFHVACICLIVDHEVCNRGSICIPQYHRYWSLTQQSNRVGYFPGYHNLWLEMKICCHQSYQRERRCSSSIVISTRI